MTYPPITVVEKDGRFGLRQGVTQLLPPGFDAVWELGHGFWGVRRKQHYCVVAPNGERIAGCILPAKLLGYQLLSWPQQRAYAQRGATGVADLRRTHRRLRQYLRQPAVPRRWQAEEVLAKLWERDIREELRLPGKQQDLVLYERGQWEWEPHSGVQPVICALESPGQFQWVSQRVLVLPDVESLLWWQLRCMRRLQHGTLWGKSWPTPLRLTLSEDRQVAWYGLHLRALLREVGVACPPEIPLLVYNEAAWPSRLRIACHRHLERCLKGREIETTALRQLIKLAWLWAHGRVQVDLESGRALVEVRYHLAGDFDPIRQVPTTPLELYHRYKLYRLVHLFA